MWKRGIDWWFLSILVIAIVVRSLFFGQQPAGTYWDETAILVDAKALAETGKDMHGLNGWQAIFPSYGDYKMPVLIWLAAASVKLFGASAAALRLPSLLAGIGTVVVTYALAQRLWPKRHLIALFATLALATAPWDIVFSKTAFEGHVAQFFLACSVWALLSIKKHWWWGIVAAGLGMIATYTYFSVRFVWPVVLLGSFLILWSEIPTKQKWHLPILWKTTWQQLLIPATVFVILLIPMAKSPFYAASNQFRLNADSILKSQDWPVVSNKDREIAGNTRVDRLAFHRHWLMAQALFQNYGDHLNLSYLFLHGDSNLRHGTAQHGEFLLIWLPAFLVGWIVIWRRSFFIAITLLFWWLAALLPASVPENTPHALRSLNALVPLCLVMGIGAEALWQQLIKHTQRAQLVRAGILVLSAGLLITSIGDFLWYYHTSYQKQAYTSWQTDFDHTISTILFFRKPDQVVFIDHADDKFFLWALVNVNFAHPPVPLKEEKYQFTQIGQLHFGKLPPANSAEYHQSLVVTRAERLDVLAKELGVTPQIYQTLTDASGSYVLAQIP